MIMEFKGTKGKWFYQEDSDAYTHIVRPENNPGQIIVHGPQVTSDYAEANLRLIASAPELLEALQGFINIRQLLEYADVQSTEQFAMEAEAVNSVLNKAEAAINKALHP